MSAERKTVRKWVWVWNFDKEERWLNQMAQSGWVLESVGFCTYHFVRCQPGEYTVRLEMRNHDEAYLAFMQEMGAEYLGRMMKWIYFRKKTEDGPFDLFSDLDSRITHLIRISTPLKVIGAVNLAMGIGNSLNPAINFGWINLLCATVLMYALGRIQGKKEQLENERLLRE